MSRTVFTLVLPEPKVRKTQAPPAKAHKNKHLYSRKRKHKGDVRDDRDDSGPQAPVFTGVCHWRAQPHSWPSRPA